MKLISVKDLPHLHTTPLAVVRVQDGRVVVEVDDEHEQRIRLTFQPYQAVRVVTADCFVLPEGVSVLQRTIAEVIDSDWLPVLRANLKRVDETATFMTKARHFIVPLQDDFLEVVAWNVVTDRMTSTTQR